tara:strand:- start:18 stop:452 length:435 start_codon:yes stop_codon:yes gene_type:complete
MNLNKRTTFRSGSIILAIPVFMAGLFCLFIGIFPILAEIGVINANIENNNSMFVNVFRILLFLTVGFMFVNGSYRLLLKKEGIFPKWFIAVFSVLFSFGIILAIVTTKNFTLLGFIIGILFVNYKAFFKNRKNNKVINTNRYFR